MSNKLINWKDYIEVVHIAIDDYIELKKNNLEKSKFLIKNLKEDDINFLIAGEVEYIKTVMKELQKIVYILDGPEHKDLENRYNDEIKKLEDKNCSYIGSIDIFGKELYIFNDDYGQQFYGRLKGKDEDISGGSYNPYLDYIVYQALDDICEEYIEDLINFVNNLKKECYNEEI